VKEISLHIAKILQVDIHELELLPIDEAALSRRIDEIERSIPEPEMRPVK